jgi:hypothetical protein
MLVVLIAIVVSKGITLLPKSERNGDVLLDVVFVLTLYHLPVSILSPKCVQEICGTDGLQSCESVRI